MHYSRLPWCRAAVRIDYSGHTILLKEKIDDHVKTAGELAHPISGKGRPLSLKPGDTRRLPGAWIEAEDCREVSSFPQRPMAP